ncbi:MAG: NADH:flavin oxidoreductase [Planctomycetia bacterium]|nr:NADH:flavin oxidoreductase [Planctomycetia bacterium]
MIEFKKIASFKTSEEFREYIQGIGANLTLSDGLRSAGESAFARPLEYTSAITGRKISIGNRWAILPMEGWDCLPSGAPSDLATRRWTKFGESGAKLIFGGEAAAVMHSGRANTRQMTIVPDTVSEIAKLLKHTRAVHHDRFGRDDDLYVGLQLTHSGRFCKPNDDKKLESKTAYAHPLLDKKFGCSAKNVLTDAQVEDIIYHFIEAGTLARDAGFDFVDIKSAHGYLGHEFLTAYDRPGPYGGSFENRTRFFRSIVEGIKQAAPDLDIAVRLSLFDFFPFEKGPDGMGRPMEWTSGNYPYAFGGDGTGLGINLDETFSFIALAKELGIRLVCATVGSPYYNPHIQRPAAFPVSDGYGAPEDPLLGVARQIEAVRQTKIRFPGMAFVGSGYTYLQEFLPLVGESVLENEDADFIGIGRMVLAYPEMCADWLEGRPLRRNLICRTFGDCTNAPRAGLVSGCYPLDAFYKSREDYQTLQTIKKAAKSQ